MDTPTEAGASINLPEPKPPLPECDRVLGLYMRAWNQVEIHVQLLFNKLLDTNVQAAHTIFHAIEARAIREIMWALGQQRLSENNLVKLSALIERHKTAATIRNRIVHGTWQIHIRILNHDAGTETGRSATWERFYQPTDPADFAKMFGRGKNRKLLAQHRFTLKDIETNAENAYALAKDMQKFTEACVLGPPPNPKPLPLS